MTALDDFFSSILSSKDNERLPLDVPASFSGFSSVHQVHGKKGENKGFSSNTSSSLDYKKNNSHKILGSGSGFDDLDNSSGRGRHPLYEKANELVNQKRFGWYQDKEAKWVNYALALFEEYYSDIKTKVLHFERFNEGKGEQEHFYVPYKTRFDKEYKMELVKKFESLKRFKKAVKVEMTCDMRRFTSISDAKEELRKSQDKLIRALNRKLDTKLEYLSCFEVYGSKTDTINPHLHIIFFGINFLVNKSYIYEKMEKYGLGENVNIEKAVRFKDAVKYAVKHAVKNTIKSEENVDERYCALIWSLNARAWTVSEGLLEKEDYKEIFGGWNFIGLELAIAGNPWEYDSWYYLDEFEERPPLNAVCGIPPPYG